MADLQRPAGDKREMVFRQTARLRSAFPGCAFATIIEKRVQSDSEVAKFLHFRGKSRSKFVKFVRLSWAFNKIPALNVIRRLLLAYPLNSSR
jgi:hypothetical protein